MGFVWVSLDPGLTKVEKQNTAEVPDSLFGAPNTFSSTNLL